MKILFSPCHYIYDEISDGSEAHMGFSLVNRIASRYPESVVVTGFKKIASKKKYEIIQIQPEKTTGDLSLKNALKFNWLYFLETIKQMKKNKFELLHHVLPFTLDNTFNLAVILNKIKKTPVLIGPIQTPFHYFSDVTDSDVNPSNVRDTSKQREGLLNINKLLMHFSEPLRKYLSDLSLKKADAIIVINNYTKKVLVNKGIAERKINVVPIGIDSHKFAFKPFSEKNHDVIEILVVAFLINRKRVDLVLRAFAEAKKSRAKLKLRIIGSGPQLETLKQLAVDLGLVNDVVFEGSKTYAELPTYYQNAHLLVSMSAAESWGQMVLDAYACGLPALSAKSIGPNEIIKDGLTGYLIEQEDYNMLAEKILFLAKNQETMKQFGINARKIVDEKYDWDKVIVPSYLKIYEEIIG